MSDNIRTTSVDVLLRNYPRQEEDTFCAIGIGGCTFNSFLVTDENGIEHEWRLHFDQRPFDQYYSDYRLKVTFSRWQQFISDDLWCQVFGYTSTYEKVIWRNKIYNFNPTQARLIAQMHGQFLQGSKLQFERSIFSKSMVNLSDYRLDKAFRSQGAIHPLFGKLIVKAENQRGAYLFQPWAPLTDNPEDLPTSWRLVHESAQGTPRIAVC